MANVLYECLWEMKDQMNPRTQSILEFLHWLGKTLGVAMENTGAMGMIDLVPIMFTKNTGDKVMKPVSK